MREDEEDRIRIALSLIEERISGSDIALPDYEHLYLFAAGRLDEIPADKRPEVLRRLARHPEALSIVAELRRSGMVEQVEGKDVGSTGAADRDRIEVSNPRLFILAVSGDREAQAAFRQSSPPDVLCRIVDYLPHVRAAAAGGACRTLPSPLPASCLVGDGPWEFGLLPTPLDKDGTRRFVELRALTTHSKRAVDAGEVQLVDGNRVLVTRAQLGWLRFVASYEAGSWSNLDLARLAIGPIVEAKTLTGSLTERVFSLAQQKAGLAAWNLVLAECSDAAESLRTALLVKITATMIEKLRNDPLAMAPDDKSIAPPGDQYDFEGKLATDFSRIITGLICDWNDRSSGSRP